MNNGKINVSIIIPVYNGMEYLEKCLESVINQTLTEIEVICIDDGSTDDSAVILEQYKKEYPEKLRVFHTKNQGVWKARERGIEEARGIYVGFVDCDDDIEPGMYEKMFHLAVKNQAEMAVTAYQRIIKSGNVQKITEEMNVQDNEIWEAEDDLYKFSFLNTALWNKIILKEIVKKHVRFSRPPRIAEDVLFLMSIYPYIHRITFITDTLYHYYVRGDTAMSHIEFDEIENILECFEETDKHINDASRDERWNWVMEITSYIHLGISLLLRCKLSESQEYIRKARKFLKKKHLQQNIYMRHYWKNRLVKVKLVEMMYTTGIICFIPFLKKYLIRIIKW